MTSVLEFGGQGIQFSPIWTNSIGPWAGADVMARWQVNRMARSCQTVSHRAGAEFPTRDFVYGNISIEGDTLLFLRETLRNSRSPDGITPVVVRKALRTLGARPGPDGSSTAKALNYSLNAWIALTRNLLDGNVPVDNNHCEYLIRTWAMGRRAWLFCGSVLTGQRAAIVTNLAQSVELNGHDPWAYLKDVLTRLPTHLNSRIDELLPHNWLPAN